VNRHYYALDENDIKEIKKRLESNQSIPKEELEKLLIFYPKKNIATNINCKFLLIKTTADTIRDSDFLKLIQRNIIFYVLNYSEYKEKKNISHDDLIRKHSVLYDKAKSKFQKGVDNTGESGELILFLLLESQGIYQIASKMRLKTSTEWPFHGVDAIHAEFNDNKMILHYGEAKMHKTFESALSSATESIKNFESNNQEDIELDIISTNIDASKFGEKYAKEIVKILDPYYEDKELLGHNHSVFLGHDWDVLKNLSGKGDKELIDYVADDNALSNVLCILASP